MNITELYRDPAITGECFLLPFKKCVQEFGYAFSDWTAQETQLGEKLLGCLTRIVHFAAGLIGSIATAALVPLGIVIKFFAQPISVPPNSHTVLTQQNTPSAPTPIDDNAIETVHAYPGDLTVKEALKTTTNFIDARTFNIAFEEAPGYSLTIRCQDIFESGAQVVVNAANTHLGGGGGIDGLIHRRGGIAYASAHRALQSRYHSHYTEGYAAIIQSGAIRKQHGIEHVIVVAGPQGTSTTQKESQLYSCYYNSLVLAHSHHKTSIAFPTISTGIFGFPKDRGAAISLRAVHDFISQYPNSTLNTISIHFLASDPAPDFEFFKAALFKD